MAFELESEKILTGGLNLLPPSDMIPTGETLACLNFRADQQGTLVTRRREGNLVSGFNSPILSLYLNSKLSRRFFCDTTGQLKIVGTPVTGASGFDGTKLGFASWQDYVWVMNPNAQIGAKRIHDRHKTRCLDNSAPAKWSRQNSIIQGHRQHKEDADARHRAARS